MQTRYRTRVGLFFAALLFGLPAGVHAQIYPQGDLSFVVGFPQGELDQNIDNVGFGVNVFAGLGFGRSPIVIGLDGGVLVYGFERRHEPFSNTIPDVTVEVQTSNAIAMGHLLLRLQPRSGAVQPYVDGLFGLKYFFTETSIHDDGFDDVAIASSVNFDDAALSYGVGGGLDIQVFGGRGGRKAPSILLNVGARYLLGSEAEYLKEGSIERRNGRVAYVTERSKTNLLIAQLGVALKF